MVGLDKDDMIWTFSGGKSILGLRCLLHYLESRGFTGFYTSEEVGLYFIKGSNEDE